MSLYCSNHFLQQLHSWISKWWEKKVIASTQFSHRFPKLSLSGGHLSKETFKVCNGDVTDESTFLTAV